METNSKIRALPCSGQIILLKEGELVLKGLNKRVFEQRLISNVTKQLLPYGEFKVYAVQSTVYVEPVDDLCDLDGAFEALEKVFGVIQLTKATACEKEKDSIYQTAVDCMGDELSHSESFKVETKRSDKSFPLTSIELSQYVGGLLSEKYPDVKVDVHTPETIVSLEVRDYAAYVHGRKQPGAGGMPVGTNGRVVSLLSGGIDSPVSTYLAAKRGLRIFPVHFFSFPYTSELAKEKVIELGKLLTDWCGPMTLQIVPFTHIQEEIRDHCPEAYFTVVMRRFMMRLAQRIADAYECSGIVTGESVGQVASQTLEAMRATEECTNLPVLRPLACADKEEIVKTARRIGTFETSILPYEDCCTVFTPKHPKTRPHLEDVIDAEKKLNVDALVQEAFEGIERIKLQKNL